MGRVKILVGWWINVIPHKTTSSFILVRIVSLFLAHPFRYCWKQQETALFPFVDDVSNNDESSNKAGKDLRKVSIDHSCE